MYFFLIRALTPHRARGIERVLPFVCALLLPLLLSLFFFAHYNRDFIFRTVTVVVVVYSLGFFPHRQQLSTAAVAFVVETWQQTGVGYTNTLP